LRKKNLWLTAVVWILVTVLNVLLFEVTTYLAFRLFQYLSAFSSA